jgi:hypothetical protein
MRAFNPSYTPVKASIPAIADAICPVSSHANASETYFIADENTLLSAGSASNNH